MESFAKPKSVSTGFLGNSFSTSMYSENQIMSSKELMKVSELKSSFAFLCFFIRKRSSMSIFSSSICRESKFARSRSSWRFPWSICDFKTLIFVIISFLNCKKLSLNMFSANSMISLFMRGTENSLNSAITKILGFSKLFESKMLKKIAAKLVPSNTELIDVYLNLYLFSSDFEKKIGNLPKKSKNSFSALYLNEEIFAITPLQPFSNKYPLILSPKNEEIVSFSISKNFKIYNNRLNKRRTVDDKM